MKRSRLVLAFLVALAIACVWNRPLASAQSLQDTVQSLTSAPSPTSAPAEPQAGANPAVAPDDHLSAGAISVKTLKVRGKKDQYSGPDTVVELPPTPMLDEEGKQQLDPDGKPLFSAPVKQQRDKKGHPLFDEGGKPVFQTPTELGYDENGKKLHIPKIKPPKMTPVTISRGTLSVDGLTAKAALNYQIADLKYIYLFAPGIGIAVVSDEPFPGATKQPGAFDGKTLTVKTAEHVLQLGSDKALLGKEAKPAYVLMDRQFSLPAAAPVMGYGTTRKAPYAWPGAKPNAILAGLDAPPVPASMMPTQLLQPCPAGQMRQPAPAALPGQPAPAQPCVPIRTARGTSPTGPAVHSASVEAAVPKEQ